MVTIVKNWVDIIPIKKREYCRITHRSRQPASSLSSSTASMFIKKLTPIWTLRLFHMLDNTFYLFLCEVCFVIWRENGSFFLFFKCIFFGALVVFALFFSILSLAIIEVESRTPVTNPNKSFFLHNLRPGYVSWSWNLSLMKEKDFCF